jgi:hypothetical protein
VKNATLTIFVAIVIISASFNTYDTAESRRDLFLSLSKKYSSDAYEILSAEPDYKKYIKHANGKTRKSLLQSYGTVVHEACHMYQWKIGKPPLHGYFITSGTRIEVTPTLVFNSTELNGFVPDSVQKNITRYDTYIGKGTSNGAGLTSQVDGIYGIISEFNAYYHGNKAAMDLYSYYETTCPVDSPAFHIEYFKNFTGQMPAYYEFQLFISWYLQYAKKHHPPVYADCMSNKPLRVTYTLLDDMFKELLAENENKILHFTNRCRDQGFEVTVNASKAKVTGNASLFPGHDLEVKRKGILVTSCGLFHSQPYLLTLLKESSHEELKKFRMEGVNLSNYKQYLD